MRGDEAVTVKIYVMDGISPLPVAFQCNGWDANQLLLAWANMYRDDPGAIDVDGLEWEGVWCSDDNIKFIERLIQ